MSRSSSNTIQACAVCKHQRRKCSPDCILARYFPIDRARQFHSVHRLFGVSNLLKLYRELPPERRDEAVLAMTYEAEVRRQDPVHGCLGVIRALSAEIEAARRELHRVWRQVSYCRTRHQAQRPWQQQLWQMDLPPWPLPPPQFGCFPQIPLHPLPPHAPVMAVNMDADGGGIEAGALEDPPSHRALAEAEDARSVNDSSPDMGAMDLQEPEEDAADSENPRKTRVSRAATAENEDCKKMMLDEMETASSQLHFCQ